MRGLCFVVVKEHFCLHIEIYGNMIIVFGERIGWRRWILFMVNCQLRSGGERETILNEKNTASDYYQDWRLKINTT